MILFLFQILTDFSDYLLRKLFSSFCWTILQNPHYWFSLQAFYTLYKLIYCKFHITVTHHFFPSILVGGQHDGRPVITGNERKRWSKRNVTFIFDVHSFRHFVKYIYVFIIFQFVRITICFALMLDAFDSL